MRSFLILAGTSFLLLCAGCETGELKRIVPVAGGQDITVELTPRGPVPGGIDGFVMAGAHVMPGKDAKEVFYRFALMTPEATKLQRIQIVDVSDDQPWPLLDDTHPEVKGRLWEGNTATIASDDPRLKWVYSITASFRAFQVTLTTANGQKSFYHVAVFPPFIKAAMRKRWGETY